MFLDTETTGLERKDEIVELAVVDCDGEILMNTLVRPTIRIPPEATRIHRITNAAVAHAPTILDLLPQLDRLLAGRELVIYNRDYDLRLLRQSIQAHRSAPGLQLGLPPSNCHCAMLLYAEHHGEWNAARQGYRWQKLEQAAQQCKLELPGTLHRALADAEVTRRLMLHLAKS